jgi:hypothetical protein
MAKYLILVYGDEQQWARESAQERQCWTSPTGSSACTKAKSSTRSKPP